MILNTGVHVCFVCICGIHVTREEVELSIPDVSVARGNVRGFVKEF